MIAQATVEAPQSNLPLEFFEALKPYGPRFLRVAKHEKSAIDDGWPDNPLSFEQLQDWLNEGGNYGVMANQGLSIVDLDDLTFREKLPETLTVQTGSGNLSLYYRSNLTENGTIDKGNKGHIQVNRKYVVGPGSTHPNGNLYKLLEPRPIAWITKAQLDTVFGYLLRWTNEDDFNPQAKKEFDDCNISITQVVSMQGLHKRGNKYQGPHPQHGSTTGQNFCVNPTLNVWHCFRHGTGGGPLTWIAIQEGIINCEDAARAQAFCVCD